MTFSVSSAPEPVALAFNKLVDLFVETDTVTPQELRDLTGCDPEEARRRWWIEMSLAARIQKRIDELCANPEATSPE